jgi:hypothetical protein
MESKILWKSEITPTSYFSLNWYDDKHFKDISHKAMETSFMEMFAANDWKPFQSCFFFFLKTY